MTLQVQAGFADEMQLFVLQQQTPTLNGAAAVVGFLGGLLHEHFLSSVELGLHGMSEWFLW